MNIGLFGVEIFIEGSSHYTVIIYLNPKFGCYFANICIIFLVSSFVRQYHQVSSILNIFNQVLNLFGAKFFFGRSKDKQICFFDLFKFNWILVKTNLYRCKFYFVCLFVFFGKLL